jgi:hypothetical protein
VSTRIEHCRHCHNLRMIEVVCNVIDVALLVHDVQVGLLKLYGPLLIIVI